MTTTIDAVSIVSFLMPASVVMLALMVAALGLWWGERMFRKQSEAGADFLRDALHRCSDERRALVNGAPVQLVNVCRECKGLMR